MDKNHAKYVLNDLLVVIFNQILSIEAEALLWVQLQKDYELPWAR